MSITIHELSNPKSVEVKVSIKTDKRVTLLLKKFNYKHNKTNNTWFKSDPKGDQFDKFEKALRDEEHKKIKVPTKNTRAKLPRKDLRKCVDNLIDAGIKVGSLHGIDEVSEKKAVELGCVPCGGSCDDELGKISKSVYDKINGFILDMVKKDNLLPWDKPWNSDGLASNYDSKKKPYRGINSYLNAVAGAYETPYFLTKNQIEKRKGKLSKNATPYFVVFFKFVYKIGDNYVSAGSYKLSKSRKKSAFPVLLESLVYNIADVEEVNFRITKEERTENQKIDIAEQIIKGYPNSPKIRFGGDKAFHQEANNLVQMPRIGQFKDSASYYGTFFHELIHSTGTKKRLNREKGRMFGDSKYAFEELIAESGGMYLSATCGFVNKTKSRSATYIQGWLTAVKRELEDNKTTLVKAFSDAQKGADYILNGKTYEPKPDTKATVKKVTKPKKGEQLKMELNGIDDVNKAFNEKLSHFIQDVKNKITKDINVKKPIFMGVAGNKLQKAQFKELPIKLNYSVLYKALFDKHKESISEEDLRNLPDKLHRPIMVFHSTDEDLVKNAEAKVVLIDINKVVVACHLKTNKNGIEIYNIASIHRKNNYSSIKKWIEKEKLIWEDKRKSKRLKESAAPIATRGNNHSDYSNIRKATKKHTTSSKKEQDTPIKPDNIGGLGGIFTPISEKDTIKAPDTFRLNGELGKFIQDIQKFKHLITLNGDRGAGKTTFLFQLMNGFAELGMKVGFFSLEQGGLESKDTRALVERYVNKRNEPKIAITGEVENGLETVKQYANQFDVVAVDSWQKLGADQSEVDSLRQEFPNTIFVVIFQENAQGKMRGGSAAGFDATVVLKAYAGKRFQDNYIQAQKNRGNDTNWTYKIMDQKAECLE